MSGWFWRVWRPALFGLGLLCLLLGQRGLFYQREDRPEPVLAVLLGLLILSGLAWARRRARRGAPLWPERLRRLPRLSFRPSRTGLGVAAAALLSLEVTLAAHGALPWSGGGDGWQFGLWLAAMGGLALLFVRGDELDRLRALWASRRDEWLTLGGILALALALRLLALGSVPRPLTGLEAAFSAQASELVGGERLNPFLLGYRDHPNLFLFVQAGAMRLVGAGPFGLRLPAALAGAGLVLPVYGLGRLWFGRRLGLMAAFWAAVAHFPLHYGRLGLNPIVDPLLATTTLALLAWGFCSKRRLAFVLAGLSLGLSQYFYVSARLTLVLVALYVLLERGVARRGTGQEVVSPAHWPPTGRHGWLVLFGFLVAFGPLLATYLGAPGLYLDDARRASIWESDWLGISRAATGRSNLALLTDQVARAILSFNYHLDQASAQLYNPSTPLLDPLSGALWPLGLMLALWYRRRPEGLALLGWVALVLVGNGALLQQVPSSPHLLLAVPALALLSAWGLVAVLNLLARLGGAARAPGRWLVAAGLVLLVVNLYVYWGLYAPSHRAGALDQPVAAQVEHNWDTGR